MTNQPTPVILDDEALAEIEARRPRTVHYNCPFVPLSETERDALCQTVRALRAEIAEWESHRDGIIEAVKTAEARVEELEEANTALREQLAEASKNLRIRRDLIRGWQQHIQRMATILDCEALDIKVEHAAGELQSRLAALTETKNG